MARKDRKDRGLFQRALKDGTLVWGVRIAVQGRMLRFSPFKHKGEARAFYEKAKTEQREGRFFPEKYHVRGPLVQTYFDRYWPTTGQKPTGSEEAVFQAWWSKWYANRSLSAMTAEDLEKARRALLEGHGQRYGRPRTKARVNRYTQWLHQVLNHPVNRKHLPFGQNPVDQIKKYGERHGSRLIATPDQEARLIARLEQETPGVTDWMDIAVLCGLRQSEQFLRLKTDINTDLWLFVIPNAKHQDEPKIIQIPPSARPAVSRLLNTPGPWLIGDPENWKDSFPIKRWYKTKYKRAVKAIGLQSFTWHSLRHTFASRMLQTGANTKTVRHAGGWSSERMVDQVYGQLHNSFVVDAMEQAATVRTTAPRFHVEHLKKK